MGILWGMHGLWCGRLSILVNSRRPTSLSLHMPGRVGYGRRGLSLLPEGQKIMSPVGVTDLSRCPFYDLFAPLVRWNMPTHPQSRLPTAGTMVDLWPMGGSICFPSGEFVIRAQRSLLTDAGHASWGVFELDWGGLLLPCVRAEAENQSIEASKRRHQLS